MPFGWRAVAVSLLLLAGAPAFGSERVVSRAGDLGTDRQVLRNFADRLVAACREGRGEAGADACIIEDRHLRVARGDFLLGYTQDLLVAVDHPFSCGLGRCRLWMLARDFDLVWQTWLVGAVDDFVVSVSDDRGDPVVLFGTYAGARWEAAREVFQGFCIGEQCLADFGLEDLDDNAIEYPDPLR